MKLAVLVVTALLLFAGVAAAAGKPLYRTDHQAEVFLSHHVWRGFHPLSAVCFNGYYSRHEQRTHKHYPQGHQNRLGEDTFRSFACTYITQTGRSFHLYLVTTRLGWRISVDR